eukprot:SAG11_NODE_1844_length_4178_cov_4.716842_4_plen_218_part_00
MRASRQGTVGIAGSPVIGSGSFGSSSTFPVQSSARMQPGRAGRPLELRQPREEGETRALLWGPLVAAAGVSERRRWRRRTKAPDVDLEVVFHTKDDFRRAVGARLHVRTEMVRDVARGAEVDDLDIRGRVVLRANVVRHSAGRNQRPPQHSTPRTKHGTAQLALPGVELELACTLIRMFSGLRSLWIRRRLCKHATTSVCRDPVAWSNARGIFLTCR